MPRDIHNAPRPRNGRPGFHTKVISLDLSDGLLDPLHAIAQERGISTYKLIREYIYDGIKDHYADKRLAAEDADERKNFNNRSENW